MRKCNKISEILDYLGEKPKQDSVRIGDERSESGGHRPIKVSLARSAHVIQILGAVKKLKSSDKFSSVFICPDRSPEERKAYKKLVEEVKRKRDTETDKVHVNMNN